MCADVRSGAGSSPAGAKEQAGQGEGWDETGLRAPTVRMVTLPQCSLVGCWQGAWSIPTPSIAKLVKGQGMEEDDPDPRPVLPSLWYWGGPVRLCSMCACLSLCMCLFAGAVCPRAPGLQLSVPGCLSPVGLCLRGIRQGFRFQGMQRDAQVAQQWDSVL